MSDEPTQGPPVFHARKLSGEYVFENHPRGVHASGISAGAQNPGVRSSVSVYRYKTPGGSVVHLDEIESAELILFILRRCPDVRAAVAGDLARILEKEVAENGPVDST